MVKITPKQVGACIASVDWGPGTSVPAAKAWLDQAIAIAMAESGLDVHIVSDTGDYGLWQINKAAHGDMFAELRDENNIFDPLLNTSFAKRIWQNAGGKWTPWTAYNSRSYVKYLGQGEAVYNWLNTASDDDVREVLKEIGSLEENDVQGDLDLPDNPIPDIPGAISDVGNKIVLGAKAAGFFILAVILLILGVMFLLKDTTIGKRVIGAASPGKKIKLAQALTK